MATPHAPPPSSEAVPSPRDDDATVAAFEACTLAPSLFHHREHVLVAWAFLRDAPFDEGATRFIAALTRFASAHGFAAKYDEALTRAWLTAVHGRLSASPSPDARERFDAFAAAHPELLEGSRSAPRALR